MIEPLAFALEVDKGTVETAAVIPSGALSFAVSGMISQAMGRMQPAAPTKGEAKSNEETKAPTKAARSTALV